MAEVHAVFATLHIHAVADPSCDITAAKPCRVRLGVWDDLRLTDDPCDAPHLDAGDMDQVSTLLNEFAHATPTPTPAIPPTRPPTPTPLTIDLSATTTFTYQQAAALGFCPDIGEVLSAVLHADGHGGYTFSAQILLGLRDGCVGATIEDCAVVRSVGTHPLTPAEVTQVTALFSSVRYYPERDPICADVALDPCIIHYAFFWDMLQVSDYPCSPPRVDDAQMRKIRDVMNALAGVVPHGGDS